MQFGRTVETDTNFRYHACKLLAQHIMKKPFTSSLLLLTLALSLTGCAIIKPYSIQIQQGTLLTAKQLKQVQPGMTKQQVEYLLGTPNVVDIYHANTWYYVYTNQQNHRPRAEKKFFVYFKNDKVTRIGGDYSPPSALEYTTYHDQPSTKQPAKTSADKSH